jgi:hypothetical protein
MSKTDAIKKAQRKASSPEARAKAVATMKRRREEALLAHAKMVTSGEGGGNSGDVSIPLDMIPDREPKPRKKWTKKTAKGVPPAKGVTRQEVVLALLRYLNGE